LEEAAGQGKGLRVLSGNYRVAVANKGVSLAIPSNSWIEFEPGASIKALPHNADTYAILGLRDVKNVTLVRPAIDGNKDDNAVSGGENGICIGINGSTNIRIVDACTIGAWGDGIFIGASYVGGKQYSENVEIIRSYAAGCRRQGMSIISAVNLIVSDHAGMA
jgi:hypothetical protein